MANGFDTFGEAKVDAALLENFEQVYSWSQNGVAEDAKKSFEDWFGSDAKTHVLLAPHFNGVQTPPPASIGANGTEGSGINTLPPPASNTQTPPPPHSGQVTNEDLNAIFTSKAFQDLNPKDKREKMAQMKQGNFA